MGGIGIFEANVTNGAAAPASPEGAVEAGNTPRAANAIVPAAAQSVARRRVDGGAPPLNCTGAPSYSPDRFDTRLTHPLAGHMAIANAKAMALRDFHRRGQEPW